MLGILNPFIRQSKSMNNRLAYSSLGVGIHRYLRPQDSFASIYDTAQLLS